ncbi:MAG: glutamine--fructose-6-phosphate transaminase (isomerizing) [Deltaproteobacteria bacterium]|nr:glutamine--fructose-6-phosphate transaminase (isomerizing) [Deltaproteobacteria bacterium]
MCGIVGYLGPKDPVSVIVKGLEKLEYRGYDSAGVATIYKDELEVFRAQGKLENLKNLLATKYEHGKCCGECSQGFRIGIGHTRWATHGRPSEVNAHPHVAGNVCVVHNGIIENYLSLKKRLQDEGCTFRSETDTEIAAHLINYYLQSSKDLTEAVSRATKELVGSYALVVISTTEPDSIVVARNATPVVVGLSKNGEHFVASDITAILEHTNKIVVIEDGELATINPNGLSILANGEIVERAPIVITWDPITAEKGGYRHFMLKEIHEQPQVITDTFRGRIDQETGDIFLDGVTLSDEDFKRIQRITISACGTALHVALVARFYLEQMARVYVDVDYASEFRYRTAPIDSSTLFIVISQSGETADTLGALRVAKKAGAKTLAICNVQGSTIAREADNVFYTHAGPEISVASTKAFVTQLTAAYMLSLRMAKARGTLSAEEIKSRIQDLVHLPALVKKALEFDRSIEKIARKYGRNRNFLFLGRGLLYPIALEGALKMKEISYLHAEGYPAGEMKHGPIALVDEETPVVVIMGKDGSNYEKTMSNLMEVESRGARIIAVADHIAPEIKELAWETITLGDIPTHMLPVVLTIPLQLLAYHVAVYHGTDVDQPRNLAKSVTVE